MEKPTMDHLLQDSVDRDLSMSKVAAMSVSSLGKERYQLPECKEYLMEEQEFTQKLDFGSDKPKRLLFILILSTLSSVHPAPSPPSPSLSGKTIPLPRISLQLPKLKPRLLRLPCRPLSLPTLLLLSVIESPSSPLSGLLPWLPPSNKTSRRCLGGSSKHLVAAVVVAMLQGLGFPGCSSHLNGTEAALFCTVKVRGGIGDKMCLFLL
ncbi:hypothetical protein AKJ16_DCAP12405 [Drosera capensis]